MKTSNLAFGPIGRCACGSIGKRRDRLDGEPVCDTCLPNRRAYLRTIDQQTALVVGQLTSAQRKARIAWLTGSFAREAALLEERADILAHARVEHETTIEDRA
jgi:hypothetical protein